MSELTELKTKSQERWEQIQAWMNENKDLLIMVASPAEDAINISYNKRNTFVKFPPTDKDKGVIFNVLRQSKFTSAIDPLMCGIIKAAGLKTKENNTQQVLQVIGGSIKAIGEDIKRSAPVSK